MKKTILGICVLLCGLSFSAFAENEEIINTENLADTTIVDTLSADTMKYVYVDLGLSVKWAACNIGANAPEDYGEYFAWGETATKNFFGAKYAFLDYRNKITKYCTNKNYGALDDLKRLQPIDDVAHVTLGDGWRIPTNKQFEELRKECKWTWTKQNDVQGFLVTGKNGNSIFLPATGCKYFGYTEDTTTGGGYWSSSIDENSPSYAHSIYFDYLGPTHEVFLRPLGLTIRAVYIEKK